MITDVHAEDVQLKDEEELNEKSMTVSLLQVNVANVDPFLVYCAILNGSQVAETINKIEQRRMKCPK